MSQIILLETPCHVAIHNQFCECKNVGLYHKPSKRGVMLTSDETNHFLSDYANWKEAMEPAYLASMLWEAHAAPILAEIDMKGNK